MISEGPAERRRAATAKGPLNNWTRETKDWPKQSRRLGFDPECHVLLVLGCYGVRGWWCFFSRGSLCGNAVWWVCYWFGRDVLESREWMELVGWKFQWIRSIRYGWKGWWCFFCGGLSGRNVAISNWWWSLKFCVFSVSKQLIEG